MTIFPNPADNNLNVIYNRNLDNVSVNIYNILGEQVYNSTITAVSKTVTSIDVSNLVNGYYLVAVSSDTETQTFKLQIAR